MLAGVRGGVSGRPGAGLVRVGGGEESFLEVAEVSYISLAVLSGEAVELVLKVELEFGMIPMREEG